MTTSRENKIQRSYYTHIRDRINRIYNHIETNKGKVIIASVNTHIMTFENMCEECIEYYFRKRKELNKEEIATLSDIVNMVRYYRRNGVVSFLKKYKDDKFLYRKKSKPAEGIKRGWSFFEKEEPEPTIARPITLSSRKPSPSIRFSVIGGADIMFNTDNMVYPVFEEESIPTLENKQRNSDHFNSIVEKLKEMYSGQNIVPIIKTKTNG
jgi:hypothetical protein